MSILLEIDNADGRGRVNYTRYLASAESTPVTLRDRMNQPALLDFSLVPSDDRLIAPRRSGYVRLSGLADALPPGGPRAPGPLFTGYLTNEPAIEFLGVLNGQAVHGYRYQATSEEYLLNVKRIGVLPPFLNQTAGQILRFLTEQLQPGRFDLSQVAEGALVPVFVAEPDQSWSEIARELAEQSGFSYRVLDAKVIFQPVGDQPAGVSVNERNPHFRPEALEVAPLGNPIHNDVTVFGGSEPQATYREYFIGDGFTSQFALSAPVFGSESARLLADDFTGATFDSTRWKETDPQNVISLFQGRLNVTGGTGNVGDSTLLAHQAIELSGELELLHGEFEFVAPSTGILGGLYSSAALTQSDCLIGFDCSPISGTTRLRGLIAGIVQAPEIPVQSNHHYILLTRLSADQAFRSQLSFFGSGTAFGGGSIPAAVRIVLEVRDIDLADPTRVTNTILYESELTLLPPFVFFAPINSADLHVVCNFLQVTRPIQARLTTEKPGELPRARRLGFGIAGQDATITSDPNQNRWTLEFYDDTIPVRGEKLTISYRAAGRARARVRDTTSIASEAAAAGDDGMRAVVLQDIKPLPRTSAETELAALAYLAEHTTPRYEGQYSTWSDLAEGFPRSGRFLEVAVEKRYPTFTALIRGVTSEFRELATERILHTLSFGQPSRFEELLKQFAEPEKILRGQEVPPLSAIGTGEVGNSHITEIGEFRLSGVSSSFFTLDFGAAAPAGQTFEVRRGDQGWSKGSVAGSSQNVMGTYLTQTALLPRSARNTTYFIRPVASNGQTSRYSGVIAIHFPLIPARPQSLQVIFGVDEKQRPVIQAIVELSESQLADVDRVELRNSDDTAVLGRWDFGQLVREGSLYRASLTLENSVALLRSKTLHAYTQNVLGEYSTATTATGTQAVPLKPVLAPGNSVGQILELLLDRVANEILETEMQVASPSGSFASPVQDAKLPGQPEKFSFVATQSGAWSFRARRRDSLGWSPWSDEQQGQVGPQILVFDVKFFRARELDPSVGAAINGQNLLPNGEFFLGGVAGQEGIHVARYFGLINAAVSGAEVDFASASNEMQWKSGVSISAANPGVRSLLSNLGRALNPGEPVTFSAALRHNGSGTFSRAVRLALRSPSTPSYDKISDIPVGRITGNYQWFSVTFQLPGTQAVPADLAVEVSVVATAGQSLATDLFCDKVILNRGHRPAAFSLALWDVIPLSWNVAAGAYDLPATSIAATPRGTDPGNAGRLAGTGTEDLDPDFTDRYFRSTL